MKKFWLIILAVCGLALAQEKPTIAVYVTGDVAENDKKAMGTRMLAALINSGRYRGIERSGAFLAKVDEELTKQRSGAIDDNQVRTLGKQFGVEYICVADITPAFGAFQLSARIIDVETAEVKFIGESFCTLETIMDAEAVSNEVVNKMFGEQTASKAAEPVTLLGAESTAAALQDELHPDITKSEPRPEVIAAVSEGPSIRSADKPILPSAAVEMPQQTRGEEVTARRFNESEDLSKRKKTKKSPFILTMRISAAAVGVAGLAGGIVFNDIVKSEAQEYNKAMVPEQVQEIRKSVEDNISKRKLLYTVAAASAGVFTVTLLF